MKHKVLDFIATILVIVGALNWGLVGLFSFNLVSFIFGKVPVLEHLIYIVVGLAGIYMIFLIGRFCSSCAPKEK